MSDFLRILIPVIGLLGLGAMIVIPFWFAQLCFRLLTSAEHRANFKARWPMFFIFGFATWMIVYSLDLFPRHTIPFPSQSLVPLMSLSPEAIDEADAIVEGSFLPDQTVSSSRNVFGPPFYRNLKVDTYVIPFQIERSVKGPASGTLNVKIFVTFGPNTPFQNGLPLKEKMLLLLKKEDTDSGTYTLVSQNTTWLVLAGTHAANASTDPATFILDDAKAFLNDCLEHPGLTASVQYMTRPSSWTEVFNIFGGISTTTYAQTDPARKLALRAGKSLGETDPEFLAIARKYEGEYGELGELARSIRANSGDYSVLLARLHDATAHPTPPPSPGFHLIGNPGDSLPFELAKAIEDCPDPAKIFPLVQETMASSDPKIRHEVMSALSLRQNNRELFHGNQLGHQFYPLLAQLLDDPDRKIQYKAMDCLFEMSGEIRKPFGHREIEFPAWTLFEKDPDSYLATYRAWWEKHKDALIRNQ